jgi:hypothetical protein
MRALIEAALHPDSVRPRGLAQTPERSEGAQGLAQRVYMRASQPAPLTAALALLYTSACDYSRDYVAPSCYGDMTQAGRPAAANSGSARPASNPNKAPATAADSSSTTASNNAGASAAPIQDTRPVTASASSCDLTGPWLLTVHKVTDGLGNLQTVHDYYFYEIAQQGDAFSVTRSLKCGSDVVGGGAFAITVSYAHAQAGVLEHVTHNGRKGTSVSAAAGCQISFAEQYTVGGATVPYYLDPSTTLPTVDDMATDTMPGWEDWDEDGKPGITGVLEGTITGEIYTAAREWASYSGNAADVSSLFKLAVEWDQEPNVMSFEGSPFLGSSAVRAADPSLHFVQLARLSAEQASGQDLALCQRLVALAPTLTPEAAGM